MKLIFQTVAACTFLAAVLGVVTWNPDDIGGINLLGTVLMTAVLGAVFGLFAGLVLLALRKVVGT